MSRTAPHRHRPGTPPTPSCRRGPARSRSAGRGRCGAARGHGPDAASGSSVVTAVSALGVLSADLPDPDRLARTDLRPADHRLRPRRRRSELGRFERERRRVVALRRTSRPSSSTPRPRPRTARFWDNPGIDPANIVAAVAENAAGEGERGASTITQQLVRARLLPEDVVAPASDRYLRKVKEIIQSLRLTDAFPGEDGKRGSSPPTSTRSSTATARTASPRPPRIYFGGRARRADRRPGGAAGRAAQVADHARPVSLRRAQDDEGRLVVPRDAAAGRASRLGPARPGPGGRWTALDAEPSCRPPSPSRSSWPATSRQPCVAASSRGRSAGSSRRSSGRTSTSRPPGTRSSTTLDWRAQRLAETLARGGGHRAQPLAQGGDGLLKELKIPEPRPGLDPGAPRQGPAQRARSWPSTTGPATCWPTSGSAGYARNDLASREFEPKYDAAGDGARQPGLGVQADPLRGGLRVARA